MKIVYVLHGRFPTEKAHGVQVAKLCEAFGRLGNEVILIAPEVDEKKDAYAFYSVDQIFMIKKLALRIFMRGSKAGFLFEKIRFLAKAAREIKKAQPDLVITREPLLLLFRISVPTIVEMHYLPRKKNIYTPVLLRAKAIIAKTQSMKEELVRSGLLEKRICVLSNAIDPKEYGHVSQDEARKELGIDSNERVALYAGSFQSWKGIDTVLKSAPFIPDITIMLVGGKVDEIERYRKITNENVRLVGSVPHGKIPTYLSAADVLLLPNERGNELSERFTSPLKLFEYQAAERPVVASRLPSIQEVLAEDEGYLFEPGDAQDLARTIRRVFADSAIAHQRAESAHVRVIQNTWSAYAVRLISLKEHTTSSVQSDTI